MNLIIQQLKVITELYRKKLFQVIHDSFVNYMKLIINIKYFKKNGMIHMDNYH